MNNKKLHHFEDLPPLEKTDQTAVRGPAVGATVGNPVVKTFSVNWFCVFSCLSYQLKYIHATRHQIHPGGTPPRIRKPVVSAGWPDRVALVSFWGLADLGRFQFCGPNKSFRTDLITGYE